MSDFKLVVMINFYKENGIGKIAFASGEVIPLSGEVSLFADPTTRQIVISKNDRALFWINENEPLQVEGQNITGNIQQKKDLIAPVLEGAGSQQGASGFSWDLVISDGGALGTQTFNEVALLSPNGTSWEIKKGPDGFYADDNTTLTGVASITRQSSDGSTWTITIENNGVFKQSKP